MSYVKNILVVEPDRNQTLSFNCPLCKTNNWSHYGGNTYTCCNKHSFLFDIYLSGNGTVNLALIPN